MELKTVIEAKKYRPPLVDLKRLRMVLVANKIDLIKNKDISNPIIKEEALELTDKLNQVFYDNKALIPYIECSGITGVNIENLFTNLIDSMIH